MDLRPYQKQAINAMRMALSLLVGKIKAGATDVVFAMMLYSPTGSGKTEMGLQVVQNALEREKRVLWLCTRKELVRQTVRRAAKSGIEAGVIQAENTTRLWMPFKVACLPTLISREGMLERVLAETDLIVVDEAHGSVSKSYGKVWDAKNPMCPVVGLSATPFAKGLERRFTDIVVASTISELIADGYLMDGECYAAPDKPDLSEVRITGGDYNEEDLGIAMSRGTLIAGIVKHWLQHNPSQDRTVVFATTINHSKEIVAEFVRAGIKAEHLDAYTPDDDRQAILGRLERGETKVVSNVGVLAEGWDCPAVSVMVLARPTRSLIRYIQMAGRIFRPAPGKTKWLLLDHSDTVRRLGLPTEELPISLDPKALKERENRKDDDEKLPKECPACGLLKLTRKCPHCGFEPESKGKSDVVYEEGTLVRVLPKKDRKKLTDVERQTVYGMFVAHAKEKGFRNPKGFAWHKFQEYAPGVPVPRTWIETPPTIEIDGWLKSAAIRYHKSQERRGASHVGSGLLDSGVHGTHGG